MRCCAVVEEAFEVDQELRNALSQVRDDWLRIVSFETGECHMVFQDQSQASKS
jgi:hypothetical protein